VNKAQTLHAGQENRQKSGEEQHGYAGGQPQHGVGQHAATKGYTQSCSRSKQVTKPDRFNTISQCDSV